MTPRVTLVLMLLAPLLAGCGKDNARALQGWVEADIVYVSADEQGRVETLKVREGDRVAQGDLLFTLDDNLQKADVAVKAAAVTTAQQSYDRAKELLRSAAGTQKALDDAAAALSQAKANLEWSQTRLARRRAASPAAGAIQEVYYRPGETVPTGKPVIALLPPSNLKLRFFAPETLVATIRIDDTVAVSCDSCAAGLTAKVSFIARNAEFTPPVIYSREERAKLVYLVEARPAEPEKLRVGQPITVTLAEPPK
jgi:HlyD family secretion protein